MIKSSLIYLLSNIFNKAIPFLMLPLVTRYVDPSEFGKWSIYLVVMQFADAVIGMNLESNIIRNYFCKTRDELRLYFGNTIYALIINLAVAFFILLAIKGIIFQKFQIRYSELLLILPYSFCETFTGLYLCYLRNEKRAVTYGFFQIVKTALNFALSLVLLHKFQLGWQSLLWGLILSGFITSLCGLLHLLVLQQIRMTFQMRLIKEIYAISIPLIFYSTAFIVVNLSDRIFVEAYAGFYAVGIYGFTNSLASYMTLYTDSFIKAWSPWFFAKISVTESRDENLTKIVKAIYAYALSSILVGAVGWVFIKNLVPLFFPEKYWESIQYVWILVVGLILLGLHRILQPFFIYSGKTRVISVIMFLSGCINIVLNYLLIPKYAISGAVYATLFSYVAHMFMIALVFRKQVGPMPWLFFRKTMMAQKK